jgi:hypothetical protein
VHNILCTHGKARAYYNGTTGAAQEMPVEQIGHGLITEAAKPPFLNKGPPTCTNCISRGHNCKPCITSRTNCCQRCHNGHMVCSCGRTAPELLTSFERLCPILAVLPSGTITPFL